MKVNFNFSKWNRVIFIELISNIKHLVVPNNFHRNIDVSWTIIHKNNSNIWYIILNFNYLFLLIIQKINSNIVYLDIRNNILFIFLIILYIYILVLNFILLQLMKTNIIVYTRYYIYIFSRTSRSDNVDQSLKTHQSRIQTLL